MGNLLETVALCRRRNEVEMKASGRYFSLSKVELREDKERKVVIKR